MCEHCDKLRSQISELNAAYRQDFDKWTARDAELRRENAELRAQLRATVHTPAGLNTGVGD